MRLACITCDTEQADGVKRRPKGWTDVGPDPVPKERAAKLVDIPACSLFPWPKGARLDDVFLYDDEPGHWWTHLGYCPECSSGQLDLDLSD